MSSRSPELDLPALQADGRVLWTTDVLRYGDTDANGHINNSVFSVFCESGRVDFLQQRLPGLEAGGAYFVIARLTVEFRAELFYPGTVRCGTWLSSLGRSSMIFAQALLDDAGRVVGASEAVSVVMDGTTRRPLPLPPDLRAGLEPLVRPGARAVA